ncbi:hypothetical protein EXIGLDRAFT_286253 [Exidia glandulosa HHB12029]|uniref:Uncharacterized protein n=1 Tax=Exidia glandulosa HHB12029 TaxID=1314781 RepID=A0A165M568_EXIGL|nr:hypothetical protein EXIGLDRAFT_286253 [Exidia glandulosa HHB12029]
MAQYYSAFFQSGLQPDKTPTPSRTVTPAAAASSSRHAPAPSSSSADSSKSMYFVFGKTGSLRAPGTRPASQTTADYAARNERGHASFLSMDASEPGTRSMISALLPYAAPSTLRGAGPSADALCSSSSSHRRVPSNPVPPPLAIPQRKGSVSAPGPDSPPSPALSTQSTQSHLMRPPPSPVPSTRSLKPSTSIRRADVHSTPTTDVGTMRSLSNASSFYRRTNRSRALAALEGRPEHTPAVASRLRSVPETRSFVPFGDSDEEEEPEQADERTRYQRFVEKTRAAALREKEERERARRQAEEEERRARAARRGTSVMYTSAQGQYPEPPPSAPAYAYNYNFIDLDDDGSNSSTRTRSDLSRNLASMSIVSPRSQQVQRPPMTTPSPAPSQRVPPAPSPAPSRVLHAPVPVRSASQQRPGWESPALHIASAA